MTRKEIAVQIYIIFDRLVGGYIDVKEDSDLEFDLMVDSLDRIEIITEIEKVFGIDIKDKHADAFKTVGDIINYIDVRINHS